MEEAVKPLSDIPAINRFLSYCRIRTVPSKTVVIHAGDLPDVLYYIISGSVEVMVEDEEGNEMVLAYLNKGQFFGEMGLFHESPLRSAWVRTRNHCELAEMTYPRFRQIAAESPGLVFELATQLATRLDRTNRKLSDLAFVDVTGRVAHAIMDLCGEPDAMTHPEGMQIKVSRQELSRLVGCSREMAGRVLKVLEDQGLLRATGKTIVVFNARPKMKTRPVVVPVQGGKGGGAVRNTRVETTTMKMTTTTNRTLGARAPTAHGRRPWPAFSVVARERLASAGGIVRRACPRPTTRARTGLAGTRRRHRNSPTESGPSRMVAASLVPNVGIVVGRQAVLVIDTGMGARNAATVLQEVAKVGAGKPIYIVTTHVHPEHDMGAHAFPQDSKLIRSKDQIADIAQGAGMKLVPVFAQRSALNVELLKDAKHRDADIVFDREYTSQPGWRERQALRHGYQSHAGRYGRRWSTASCSQATWRCARSLRPRIPTATIQ